FYDITSHAVIVWAAGLTLSGICLAYILFPPRDKLWPVQSAVLAVLAAGGLLALYANAARSEVRLLVYEYSSISRSNLQVIEEFLDLGHSWENEAQATEPPRVKMEQPVENPAFQAVGGNRPLIVFVVIDACRPDHMGIYGYERMTTPNLKRYEHLFVRFNNAVSQATATSCSMRHFFTGHYSSRFMLKTRGIGPFFINNLIDAGYDKLHLNIIGSDYNGISALAFLRDMPPELLARVRYYCADEQNEKEAIDSFTEERLKNTPFASEPEIQLVSGTDQNDCKKVRSLLQYLDSLALPGGTIPASGLFAYVHMTASHFPWRKREAGTWYGKTETDLYDHNISFCDSASGELLDGLRERGLLDDAILIFTADHGTGLNEHGRYGGFNPYIEQINVPLLIHIPGIPAREEPELVALFDIAPTLVVPFFPEYADNFDGISLWPLLTEHRTQPDRVIFGLNSFADSYFLI
ncbi:unnamed protein product, partial [marine sediment metagenome]